MRTRVSDFFNTQTQRPELSFQFFADGRWQFVRRDDGQPMRWHERERRNAARALFSGRKLLCLALQDLQKRGLHTGQPDQAATPSTTTSTTPSTTKSP